MFVHIQVIGNIVRDVELKEFATSKKATTAIAYTTGYGEKKKTSFLDVEAWGQKADTLKRFALKGTRIFLTGSLEQNEWTDQQGAKRTKFVMVVQDVVLISPKDKSLQADLTESAMPFGKANAHLKNATPEGQGLIDMSDMGLPF